MATVALDHVWLHQPDDLDTFLRLAANEIREAPVKDGEVRVYAGGRKTSRTGPTVRRTIEVRCQQAPRDVARQLEAWFGQVLVYRDPRGRLLHGAVYAAEKAEYEGGGDVVGLVDVAFTVHEVDYTSAEA